jgi:hypothetical protein
MQWFKVGSESRVMVGCDGGMFLSQDGGFSWVDKNQNLRIKQFYSCAINPTAGSNILYAGAQDNGCHLLTGAGLSSSTEVTGGDGAYVHMSQTNPQILMGSYIYNQYRRSTNGGSSWTSVNLSSGSGYFINPFDYDDATNTMYSSNANSNNSTFRRWDNANTTNTSQTYVVNELFGNDVSTIKVSPYTPGRIYVGGSGGAIVKINNANTVTSSADISTNATTITGIGMSGYINCINTGTSDNVLVATITNYNTNNVWYSTNGGTSWTAVDGNLPNMPVWWAVFEPGSDSKLILGTETGIWATAAVNGASTVWANDANFPMVRTRMLQVRTSDNTIVAATYGRGLFTAQLSVTCSGASINTQPVNQVGCPGGTTTFSVNASGTGLAYQWRKNGGNISGATTANLSLNNVSAADVASYDVVITGTCGNATSNAATLTLGSATVINTQPTAQSVCSGTAANFSVGATGSGISYQWRKNGTSISGANSSTFNIATTSLTDAGSYDVVVTGSCGSTTSSPVALGVNTCTAVPTVDPDVTQLVLMPNAINGNSVLRINVRRAMNITWSVIDASGRVVMTFTQKATAGQHDLSLQLNRLAKGSYFVKGTTDKGRLGVLKFEKL